MEQIKIGNVRYRELVVLGRAAVGIWLALNAFCKGKSVLLPANICYAAAYPVLYAGKKLCFCDVDPVSGNVTADSVRAAWTPEVGAAIIPHMYGQPVAELPQIAAFCRERNVVLIEDCASAMGAEADDYLPGSMGDCVVYSTGYAKTMDLGIGGLLCSNILPLNDVLREESVLPLLSEEAERNLTFFSHLYRFLRNEATESGLKTAIYAVLADVCREEFLFSLPEERKRWIISQLDGLPEIVRRRRSALIMYTQRLQGCGLRLYPFASGAVPWRFNCFAEPEIKQGIISACLKKGLPVSDWYPQITPMFGINKEFPGAAWHEARILNFPLPMDEETISQICDTIKESL